VSAAGEAAGNLYGYGHTPVLFKPTKATEHPFRPTPEEAMSYFVGGANFEGGYTPEDGGFAINNGKGFSNVVFKNHAIDYNGQLAIAMGTYTFTCATSGDVNDVEYVPSERAVRTKARSEASIYCTLSVLLSFVHLTLFLNDNRYTFGYKRNDDGKVRIFLHHSSVPFNSGVATTTTQN